MSKKNEPIRIAQIIGKWVGGGVEAVVMNYYRHIDHSKIQFDFICDDDSTNIPYEEIEKLGGKVILIPPYQKVFKYHKELKKVLKEGNYKIVHSHINTLSVFSLWAAKSAGVPVRIAHSHSTTNKKEKKKNMLKQVLRPFSKIFATDYMCCSELAGRWLFGDKEYNNGNVYLLNNAIDLDKFRFDKKVGEKKRKELSINNDTLVIGHIGRFVEQKNHSFLLDIFNEIYKKNNNSVLLLAGQGPLMDEMKEKVNNLNLNDCVRFLGQRSDAAELYQAFDVFLLPSLYEGLPVVGVEAQASGNLCYLSNDMTKETKVLDSTVFMSLENSAEEWADAILKDEKKYKKHDTKEEVSKYGFNIEKEIIKLENYYIKKNKKKIVHLTNSNVFSGLESVSCQIIENSSSDFDHIYVTKDGPIVDELIKRQINYELISKMNVREIRRIIKKTKPKLIHSHDFTPSFISSLSSGKIPIISHIHQNPEWLKKINIKSFIFLLSSLKAKKILIVSESIEKEYIFSKIIRKKIICVENPISCDRILEKCNINDKKKFDFCCVGRVEDVKNPYLFIQIIKKIKQKKKNIRAVWVGSGSLLDDLNEIVEIEHLQQNIQFVGFSDNPYQYLAKSKIFLLCSKYEGFGLVAFEALTLGLPCIVSNVGGLKNIVDNDCGHLCSTVDEYVNELEMLIENSDIYNKKSTKAKLKAKQLENYSSYFNKLDKLYREL